MSVPHGAALRLEGVGFSYAGLAVIRDLSLELEPGEMIALLGASGCGKTTILKLIAGLLAPDSGTILMDGKPTSGIPVEKRRVGMVFQKPLLFPYLSVAGNVGFSLKMRGAPPSEIDECVQKALAMVRLEGYGPRRPSQLSGGQEQRVALARALVSDPRILLLDEPFSALDENLRVEVRTLVRAIQRELRITAIFVTHDRAEAAAMAHKVAFLHASRIEQCGSPREFYENPATPEAARFFGWQILQGALAMDLLQTALGAMRMPERPFQGKAWVAFRPEAVSLGGSGGAVATVDSSIDLGARIRTRVSFSSGESIEAEHGGPALEPGSPTTVTVAAGAVRLFPRGPVA